MAARTRTHIVSIGVALAALVLAGCANAAVLDRTATPQEALARVQAAADKVTEAESARLAMTQRTIFAGEDVAASTATTVGVYDYAAHTGQMDTTIKSAGIPLRITERTLVIGSTVYIKTPDPPPAPDGPDGGPPIPEEHHKPWTKLELPKELAGRSGFGPGFGPLPYDGPGDPTEALWYLKAVASKVSVVGEEQVRGTPTTRYAVTFDLAKLAARPPGELEGLAAESGLTFPRPADVWIDRQGRLRKMQYAVTMKVPDELTPGPMTIETTLELYDFGVPVHVTPPPASQVEVIRPELPPPGCTHQKGNGTTGSSAAAQGNTAQAEPPACPQGWSSSDGGASGP
jgi:outer membrane murein-binding lipoprotein Lpp